MTNVMINEAGGRLYELYILLAETDYKAIKYAEGQYTEDEYAPIRAQQAEWRAEINQMERVEA